LLKKNKYFKENVNYLQNQSFNDDKCFVYKI
jgi:hypothetical protein